MTIPLRGSLGLGWTGQFFTRRSYFQDTAGTQRRYRYPEVRGIWSGRSRDVPARDGVCSDASARLSARCRLRPDQQRDGVIRGGDAIPPLVGPGHRMGDDARWLRHVRRTVSVRLRRGASVLGDIGYRVGHRLDVGGEVFWTPVTTGSGSLNAIHVDAITLFRPWSHAGFYLKGGAGMAFVRNSVDARIRPRLRQRPFRWSSGRAGSPSDGAGQHAGVWHAARRGVRRMFKRPLARFGVCSRTSGRSAQP